MNTCIQFATVIWKIGQTINDTTYAKTNHKYFDATIVSSIRRSNNALKIGLIGVFELKINFVLPNILSLISIFFSLFILFGCSLATM